MRSERSGKSVPARFADRYLGPFTCGLIIKACIKADVTQPEDRIFIENALDYSTVIPYDLLPKDRLNGFISGARPFELRLNGIPKVTVAAVPGAEELSRRFEAVSRYCSLRTGDFLAFELGDPVPVPKDCRITATFGVEGKISIIVH